MCYSSPMSARSPIESQFATTEEAASHDRWVRAKVRASLADPRTCVPHDAAMAEIDAIIAEVERQSPS
jgi:hypothetical protein